MKILLVYPPFCTPVSPPHSLVHLYWFLRENSAADLELEILDLNLLFHNRKWKQQGDYFRSFADKYNRSTYEQISKRFMNESTLTYAENNKKVVREQTPEFFDDFIEIIVKKKADVIALSIVYSSQTFYSYALLKKLREKNINTIIGGPAVNQKLQEVSTLLKNEIECLEYISQRGIDKNTLKIIQSVDFSILPLQDYFTPEIVLPLRTSISCYYKQCVFCTHHGNKKYIELPLDTIKKTIVRSGAKKIFLIDDMIPKRRLLEIAHALKPLNVSWMCQLRPTTENNAETLKILHESGLKIILWGVESGSQRILDLMKKGTIIEDIKQVLKDSRDAGIKNGLYIMFGFPTETKQEFFETINFLKSNEQNIDQVSSTIFGLQETAPMFSHPEKYDISGIELQKRTILSPKVLYKTNRGLTQKEATIIRKRQKNGLGKINHFPEAMNFLREHMLLTVGQFNY